LRLGISGGRWMILFEAAKLQTLAQLCLSSAVTIQRFNQFNEPEAHLTLLSISGLNKTRHYGDDSC